MKKVLLVGAAVLLVLVAVLSAAFVRARKETAVIFDSITITDPDLTTISNGAYSGSFATPLISVKVIVMVKDHAIQEVEITQHINGRGKRAEVITYAVVSAQSLKVEVISGATYSSKAILCAIEDALNSRAR